MAKTRKKTAPAPKKKTKLVGFALLKATNPAALAKIAQKAGRRAQKLHGKRIRWSRSKAAALAGKGGKAAQRLYKKTGHPLTLRAEQAAVDRAIKTKEREKQARKRKLAKRLAQRLTAPAPVQDPEPEPTPVKDETTDPPIVLPVDDEPTPATEPAPEPLKTSEPYDGSL